ncbi:MAG: hypothetical protein KGJ35_01300 [Patescibacteria group bacterium]|nr:hypothetical protein [Patescibacteria group bacterium]
MFNHFGYQTSASQFWGLLGFGSIGLIVIILLALWLICTIMLKAYAMWHAAKRDEVWWFIALLLINTLGILELVYIIFFLKKWPWNKVG